VAPAFFPLLISGAPRVCLPQADLQSCRNCGDISAAFVDPRLQPRGRHSAEVRKTSSPTGVYFVPLSLSATAEPNPAYRNLRASALCSVSAFGSFIAIMVFSAAALLFEIS
jgi:hypothetical protein